MAKYILSHRRSGKFLDDEKRRSRMELSESWQRLLEVHSELLADSNPVDDTSRRIIHFETDPEEVEAVRKRLPPDVLLEPEIPHRKPRPWMTVMPTTERPETLREVPKATLEILVDGANQGLFGSEVTLVLVDDKSKVSQATKHTDDNGAVSFEFNNTEWNVGVETAAPAGGFWSMVQTNSDSPVTFNCPALPSSGPLGWWHQIANINTFDLNLGAGIKVGVPDTGCGPQPCLNQVENLGSIILGKRDPAGGADVDVHGTHICGLIGAHPETAAQFGGLAPGATLMSVRIYPPGDSGANQGDVAQAIDLMSKQYEADLINLSLTADDASQIEHDAIIDALERGTLCIAASGNTGGAISYPAAFPEAVSVGALGLKGWGPDGSIAASLLPSEPDRFGVENLFVPVFSNNGITLTCSAPGVGIVSTFPSRYGLVAPYSDLTGTSCATPITCAVLAALLSRMTDYKGMARNRSRAELARQTLITSCRNLNLKQVLQGNGVPQL